MLTVRMLADRVGLRLNNEADLTSQLEIRRALAARPPTAMVHLEPAGLTFIGIAATRELIGPTQQSPHPRLILHHPPPVLERLISPLWPHANAVLHASADHRSEPEPSTPTRSGRGWRQRPEQLRPHPDNPGRHRNTPRREQRARHLLGTGSPGRLGRGGRLAASRVRGRPPVSNPAKGNTGGEACTTRPPTGPPTSALLGPAVTDS